MSKTKPLYARVPTPVHERIHTDTPDGMTPARFAGVLLALGWEAWKAQQQKVSPESAE